MNRLDVVFEGGVATEVALAEATSKWLHFHMNALGMVFEV